MSFATGEDVMGVVEGVIRNLWTKLKGDDDVPAGAFRRMTYKEAMSRYGSDKPDTRFGMEISRVEHLLPADLISKITPLEDPIVEAFKLENEEGDPLAMFQFITQFLDSPKGAAFNNNPDGGPGVFVFDAKKPLCGLHAFGFEGADAIGQTLDIDQGDLIILQARQRVPTFSGGSTRIGDLRRDLHSSAVAAGLKPIPQQKKGTDFLWIVDFPLFSPSTTEDPGQDGAAGISSTHHPFTAPKSSTDIDLLRTDPTKCIADHYDLVVNGVELGGGSRRIHDVRVQEFIFRDILQMSARRLDDFSHLLDALRCGCPPHAGFALGFDRLIAVMLGRESIREVIAFPKTGKGGEDVMVGAPSLMSDEALAMYHLELRLE